MIAAMSRRRLDFLKALLIAFLAAAAADASPIPRKLDESTPGGDVKCGTCAQSPPPPALVYPSPPPPPVYSPPPPPVYSPPPRSSPASNCPPPPCETSACNPRPYQPPTNIPGPPGGDLYPVVLPGASGSVDASGLAAAIFMSTTVLAALLMGLGN